MAQYDQIPVEVSNSRPARWSPKILVGAVLATMLGALFLGAVLSSSWTDGAAGHTNTATQLLTADNQYNGAGVTWNCTNVLDWNFYNATVAQNNLGGQGPNFADPPVIRYSGVGRSADGQQIDMVVSVDMQSGIGGPYHAHNSEHNGIWNNGSFGQINMQSTTSTLFNFQLVEGGTDTPFDIKPTEKILFSVYDFDRSHFDHDEEHEYAQFVTPVASHSVSPNTTVKLSGNDTDGTLFVSSTRWGDIEDNPTNPLNMSQIALDSKISVTYVGKSSWKVLMGDTDGNPLGGRNLLFAGRSQGDCACMGISDWTLRNNLQFNNLGGKGPVLDDPPELRYSKVFKAGYEQQPIDLVITVAEGSTYSPFDTSKNGLWPEPADHDQMGQININSATETNFDFRFVASGTNDPYYLSNVLFSVYDLDANRMKLPNHEYVVFPKPVTNWTLTQDPRTTVAKSGQNDGTLRFTSTVYGNLADNPTNPNQLTPLQRSKSVTVWYSDTAKFQVTFGHEYTKGAPKRKRGGRNVLFAGPGIYCSSPSQPIGK
jgi:hypothetical protein